MTQRHRRMVDRQRGGKQRRRDGEIAQHVADQGHVLLPDLDLHRRLVPAAIGHDRAPDLKHPRAAGAVGEDMDHGLGVQAHTRAHQHRLGGGNIVDGDQQVGDQLHLHAAAKTADVVGRPREALEHRRKALDGSRIAAGIYRQVAGFRLRSGARQGTVEEDHAGGGERRPRLFLRRDRQGGHFRHHAAAPALGGQFADDLFQRRHRGQREDAVSAGTGDGAGAGLGRAALLRQPFYLRLDRVVAMHRKPRLEQVFGHRGAHDAQADHADRRFLPGQGGFRYLCHCTLPLLVGPHPFGCLPRKPDVFMKNVALL